MPPVTIRMASRLTGRNRSTLTRMIDRGRLSATRDGAGRYFIDPAELERVFGTLSGDAHTGVQNNAVHENAGKADALERELAILRERVEDARLTHERERQAWEDERAFLRRLIEKQPISSNCLPTSGRSRDGSGGGGSADSKVIP